MTLSWRCGRSTIDEIEEIFEERVTEKLLELMKDTTFRKPNTDFGSGQLKINLPLDIEEM